MRYELVMMSRTGKTWSRMWDKAPDTQRMLETAMLSYIAGEEIVFVIRYWPSRKGWRVLDARHAVPVMVSGCRRWFGHRFFPGVYPTQEAAVMHALAILGR
jgi:hypothetical protein